MLQLMAHFQVTTTKPSYVNCSPDFIAFLKTLNDDKLFDDQFSEDIELINGICLSEVCLESEYVPILLVLFNVARKLAQQNKTKKDVSLFNYLYESFSQPETKLAFQTHFDDDLSTYYQYYVYVCIKLAYYQMDTDEYSIFLNHPEHYLKIAIELLQSYQKMNQDDYHVFVWQIDLCQAMLYKTRDEHQKALAFFNEIKPFLALDDKYAIPLKDKCYCLYHLTLSALCENQYQDALDALQMLDDFEGHQSEADEFLINHLPARYHYAGWAYFMLGENQKAVTAFNQSIDLVQDKPESLGFLQIGFFMRAISYLKMNPNSSQSIVALQTIENYLRENVDAKVELERFVTDFMSDDFVSELSKLSPKIESIFQSLYSDEEKKTLSYK